MIVLCMAGIVLTSCTGYNKVLKTGDYDYMYEAAKKEYLSGHYNSSAILLQEVIAVLKGTERGEESLFLLGMSNYHGRDYTNAATVLRKFYQSYPKSVYAEEARFYCGKALYKNVPHPKLDQTDTYEAVTELQGFIEMYPGSFRSVEARDLIFKLQDNLVEKEYLSAKLYYDLGAYFGNCNFGGSNYQACIITAENALRDYPYTSLREDFSFLILKAKFDLADESVIDRKEERMRSAVDEYYSFVNEYPESKHAKEVKGRFDKARKALGMTAEEDVAAAED